MLNESRPLSFTAFALRMNKFPLLEAVLKPVSKSKCPPVCEDESPERKSISPPVPESPLPTVKWIEPPRPLVLAPLPIEIVPLFPKEVVPELNTSSPLTPDTPLFAVLIEICPEVVLAPSPLAIARCPPVLP